MCLHLCDNPALQLQQNFQSAQSALVFMVILCGVSDGWLDCMHTPSITFLETTPTWIMCPLSNICRPCSFTFGPPKFSKSVCWTSNTIKSSIYSVTIDSCHTNLKNIESSSFVYLLTLLSRKNTDRHFMLWMFLIRF